MKKIPWVLQYSWTLRNRHLISQRTSYNSMSWDCPGMLKSTSSMEVVSNRWESIRSLLRGYIPLGSRNIQVKSFDYVTSSNLKWSVYSQIRVFLLMRYLEHLQILKKSTHLRNCQVNKASSVNSGLAKICLVVNNWSRIGYCWLWVALLCFRSLRFVLTCCEFQYSWKINIFFLHLWKFIPW